MVQSHTQEGSTKLPDVIMSVQKFNLWMLAFVLSAIITFSAMVTSGFLILRFMKMNSELTSVKSELAATRSDLENIRASATVASLDNEYYRGLYDFCSFISKYTLQEPPAQAEAECLRIADRARESNWYAEDSPGWKGVE